MAKFWDDIRHRLKGDEWHWNNKGKKTHYIDEAVYTRNRLMRLMLCSKRGSEPFARINANPLDQHDTLTSTYAEDDPEAWRPFFVSDAHACLADTLRAGAAAHIELGVASVPFHAVCPDLCLHMTHPGVCVVALALPLDVGIYPALSFFRDHLVCVSFTRGQTKQVLVQVFYAAVYGVHLLALLLALFVASCVLLLVPRNRDATTRPRVPEHVILFPEPDATVGNTMLLPGVSALVIPEDAGVCVCVGRRSRENQLIACEISNVIGAARTRGATLCGLCAGVADMYAEWCS